MTYVLRCEKGRFDGYAEDRDTLPGHIDFRNPDGTIAASYRIDRLYGTPADEVRQVVYVPDEQP